MRKRPLTATSADFNVVKAYFELKRLREDVEFIEKIIETALKPSDGSGSR